MTCTEVCQRVIDGISECALRRDLQTFVDGIFLELPEDPPSKYWLPAAAIMKNHKDDEYFKTAQAIWNGAMSA